MLKKMLYPIAGLLSLALAVTVRYTPIFFIDFRATPEDVQILVQWCFILLFSAFMIMTGWVFYDE